MHGHDQSALSRPDGLSRRPAGRRLGHDGHAWTITPLYRADSEGPPTWLVLVPHAPPWRKPPTSARRHVRRDRDRGNRILFSGPRRLAGARAGRAWPFRSERPSVYRFEEPRLTHFPSFSCRSSTP